MTSERIHLRAMEPEDALFIFQWENDVDVWKHGDTIAPYGLHEIKNYISSSKDIYTDKQYRFIIAQNETEDAIGMIDLFEFDARNERAAVGIYIAKNNRNEHYASEALKAIEKYCKEQLNLHQLHCSVRSGNEQSVQLFRNCGFEICGTKKEWLKNGEDREDLLLFQKILSE